MHVYMIDVSCMYMYVSLAQRVLYPSYTGSLCTYYDLYLHCMLLCLVNDKGIMRKEERGEERDTTTHLIKIQIFTHASRVTKFSPYTYR